MIDFLSRLAEFGEELHEESGYRVAALVERPATYSAANLVLPRLSSRELGSNEPVVRELLTLLGGALEAFARAAESNLIPEQMSKARTLAGQLRRALNGTSEASLECVLEELRSLIGLDEVKGSVESLAALARVQALRHQEGLESTGMSRHLVFTGNPGTGKTTVARLIGRIYAALGVLPEGQFMEVSRADLVAGYIGHTALKVTEVFSRARGGVLFIDEAYALSRGASEEDFGQEAIDTLVKLMEDLRGDTAVIVAGYSREMADLMQSNSGLASRFTRTIAFPDYTTSELVEILQVEASRQHYFVTDAALQRATVAFESVPRGEGFGNGRLARQLLEDAVLRQAMRVSRLASPTTAQLATIEADDVPVPRASA